MSERVTAVTQEHGEIVTDDPEEVVRGLPEWVEEQKAELETQRGVAAGARIIAGEERERRKAAEAALAEYRAKVEAHVGRRREFVAAMKASSSANEDYYRWSGHAEARRHLCVDLGGPCICGHHTTPVTP